MTAALSDLVHSALVMTHPSARSWPRARHQGTGGLIKETGHRCGKVQVLTLRASGKTNSKEAVWGQNGQDQREARRG